MIEEWCVVTPMKYIVGFSAAGKGSLGSSGGLGVVRVIRFSFLPCFLS
jgi:hypothetical protein